MAEDLMPSKSRTAAQFMDAVDWCPSQDVVLQNRNPSRSNVSLRLFKEIRTPKAFPRSFMKCPLTGWRFCKKKREKRGVLRWRVGAQSDLPYVSNTITSNSALTTSMQCWENQVMTKWVCGQEMRFSAAGVLPGV